MISRCSRLSLQPPRMNSSASQSSSSGCVGRSPSTPKSPGVSTSPRPKWCIQTRLTSTRATSGCRAARQVARRRPAGGRSSAAPGRRPGSRARPAAAARTVRSPGRPPAWAGRSRRGRSRRVVGHLAGHLGQGLRRSPRPAGSARPAPSGRRSRLDDRGGRPWVVEVRRCRALTLRRGYSLQQLLLLGGAFGRAGVVAGRPELLAAVSAGPRRARARGPSGPAASTAAVALLGDRGRPRHRPRRPVVRSASVQSETSRAAGASPVRRVEGRLEDGPEAVVVLLRDRVVAVVVALGAADRQAQQRGRDDLDRVGDHLVPRRRRVGRRVAGAVRGRAQEAGRGEPVERRPGERSA